MVVVARTGPHRRTHHRAEARAASSQRIRPLQMLRAFTVVAGGPATLLVGASLAPVAAALRWPDRLSGRARAAAWAVTAAGVTAPSVYTQLVRPRLRDWGSTEEERHERYPGDPDRRPLSTATRAVTINAPAREVWEWLVQIGQDRGGFYSYDWLENLAGCHLHSADEIREDLQHLSVGDPLMMMPGVGTKIAEVRPGRSILIENWGSYVVEPLSHESCRLIARSHVDRDLGALPYLLFIELPHAIMERRMLLGIKKRAEAARTFDQTHFGGHDLAPEEGAALELPAAEAPAEYGEPEEAVVDSRRL